MEFKLLIPNRWQRWLPWFLPLLFIGCIGLLHNWPAIIFLLWAGGLVASQLVLSFLPRLKEKLFWQPLQAWVATDGVAWQVPGAKQPTRYLFTELRAYRFEANYKAQTATLLLWPQGSGKKQLRCWDTADFRDFEKTLTQAVRQYNHAYPQAPLLEHETALAKFFKRVFKWVFTKLARFFRSSVSTRILFGLLAVSAAWVGWCISQGVVTGTCLLAGMGALCYVGIWANFSDERP